MTRSLDEIFGDTFDSRDVIERLDELNAAADDDPSDLGCAFCGEGSMPSEDAPSLCVEHGDELIALRKIAAIGDSAEDWHHGEAFIPEHLFTEYAQELAEDLGAIPETHSWPASYIDWDRAANALKMDYTVYTFEYDGRSYDYYAR